MTSGDSCGREGCSGLLHVYSSRPEGDGWQRRFHKCAACGWRPKPVSVLVRRELTAKGTTASINTDDNEAAGHIKGEGDLSMDGRFLTTADVARQIGVTPETLRRWSAAGEFPAPLKIRRTVRYPAAAVERFLNANIAPESDTPEAEFQC